MVVNKHLEIPSVQSKAKAAQRRIKEILACMKNSAINELGSQDRNIGAVEPLWARLSWLLCHKLI